MLKLIQDNNHTLNRTENVFSIIKKYKNINSSNKTFSIKKQILIIEDSILEFICIYKI